MAELVITQENFEQEVLKSETPVLLDFWATWCGPCRMLGPVVAEIAQDYAGRLKVGKVNVDEQPALASAFGVSSIPLLVVVKDGKIADASVGYQQKEKVEEMLAGIV